jgi:formate dehydrogenase maturation protein FdhE
MEKLKRDILEQVEESKRPAVKKLLNTLELEAVEEYKKAKFKGRDKKIFLDKKTKEILEKFIKRELKTKEVLLVLGISESSFFKMLKEYKGPQVEEPKEIIKKQQEENQEQENYKTCNICKSKKPLSEFIKNGYTKTGIQRYRPTCKECLLNSK